MGFQINKKNQHQGHNISLSNSLLTNQTLSVTSFILSATPGDILKNFSRIIVEDPNKKSQITKSLKYTNESSNSMSMIDNLIYENKANLNEIIECCNDLRVLAKKDFKYLLKWRSSIRKKLGLEHKIDSTLPNKEGNSSKRSMDEVEEKILTNVKEIQLKYNHKINLKRKKLRKLLKKSKKRIDSYKSRFEEANPKTLPLCEQLFTIANLNR